MIRLSCIVTCILMLGFAIPGTAEATSYLKCLERSKGKILLWDSRWESDGADGGTAYDVVRVRVTNRIPDRIVELDLRARDERSSRKSRSITVESEERARVVCDRFTEERTTLRLPGRGGIPNEPPELSLPFIKYTKDGWVRAKRPARVFDVAVCRVHQREFSCLSEEKARFGIMLKSVEEEIRWSGS